MRSPLPNNEGEYERRVNRSNMAGKKRAAQTSRTSAKKRAAAKKYLQGDKQQRKKTTKGSCAAAAVDDKKYHILKLIPIKKEECIDLLREKGIDYDEATDSYQVGCKAKHSPFELKLPVNRDDVADDFVYDDHDSSDEDCGKQLKKKTPSLIRYYHHNDYSYSIVITLGRQQFVLNGEFNGLSRELCHVGLTNNAEAWISMCRAPTKHLLHVDGKINEEPVGIRKFSLHNGSVLSLYGQTGFAYRVEIQSSVLVNEKNALSRIDDVLKSYNKCCVCLDRYEVDPNSPSKKRLPIKGVCDHDFCEACLDQYFAQSLSGKQNLRYIRCPMCNREKAFDVQSKVKDHLLIDLLKANRRKSNSRQVNESPGTAGSQQVYPEVAMLRKENEKEKTRLRKTNEELEKLASEKSQLAVENARLRKRIEELESNLKEAGHHRSNQRDEVSFVRESESVQQEEQQGQADKWACVRCTLLNEMRRKTCNVCGCKRK